MALGVVIPVARQRALDQNGNPLSGAKLECWLAGTTTPQTLFFDDQLTIPLSNPVLADGNGYFPAMFAPPVALKLELRTAADAVVWQADNITPANLLTGLIRTLETGHEIGGAAPVGVVVGLYMGGSIPAAPPNYAAVMAYVVPAFNASANPAILQLEGAQVGVTALLGASGTPVINSQSVNVPVISSGGAVPSRVVSLQIQGQSTQGTIRAALATGANGAALLEGAVAFSSTIAPPQITGDQNNYAPTGIDRAALVLLSSDTSRQITGLQTTGANGPSSTLNWPGRRICLVNYGSNDIVLVHASASSSLANRFALPGAANLTLPTGRGVELIYDGFNEVWRTLGAGV